MTNPIFEFIHFDAEKSVLTGKIKGAITPEKASTRMPHFGRILTGTLSKNTVCVIILHDKYLRHFIFKI